MSKESKKKAAACGAVRILSARLSASLSDPDGEYSSSDFSFNAIHRFYFTVVEGEDPSVHAAVVDQILEGLPPHRLMEMLENIAQAGWSIVLLDFMSETPGRHGAFVRAGLMPRLCAAIVWLCEGAMPLLGTTNIPDSPALTACSAYSLLIKFSDGPESAAFADGILASGVLKALVAALSKGGEAAGFAAKCLLPVVLSDAPCAALIAAGAVPVLLEILSAPDSNEDLINDVSMMLSQMMSCDASVAEEVHAAGLDAAQLRALEAFDSDDSDDPESLDGST